MGGNWHVEFNERGRYQRYGNENLSGTLTQKQGVFEQTFYVSRSGNYMSIELQQSNPDADGTGAYTMFFHEPNDDHDTEVRAGCQAGKDIFFCCCYGRGLQF